MPLPTTPPPARALQSEPPAPGGPAPGPVQTPRHEVHTLTSDLRGAMTQLARALALDGWEVELQGTVVHGPETPLIPLLLAISAFGALVATARPWVAAGLVLAAVVCVMVDLNGGLSPLRRLLGRSTSRTLLVWPVGAPPPPPSRTPGPDGAPLSSDTSDRLPKVLVVMPARIGEGGPHPVAARVALVGAAAVALSGLLPADLQDPFAIGSFAVMLAAALLSYGAGRGRARRLARRPGTAGLVRQLAGALRERPPASLRVAVAAVGALEPWLDPVEVLLRNNAPRLPAHQTVVLAWQPGPGPLEVRLSDGARGTEPASPQLAKVVQDHGIAAAGPSVLRPSSAGQRARACGWRAITFTGGGADPEAAIRALEGVVRRLDKGAAAGEW